MKFYIEKNNTNYFKNIFMGIKVNAIYCNQNFMFFYKNGKFHNPKNATYIDFTSKQRSFRLNNIFYGYENDFTKQSWRRFVKLQAFL